MFFGSGQVFFYHPRLALSHIYIWSLSLGLSIPNVPTVFAITWKTGFVMFKLLEVFDGSDKGQKSKERVAPISPKPKPLNPKLDTLKPQASYLFKTLKPLNAKKPQNPPKPEARNVQLEALFFCFDAGAKSTVFASERPRIAPQRFFPP